MRALIIDDHPLFREALSYIISHLEVGATCTEAESLEQAMGLLSGEGYDLILLDLSLPGASGLSGVMNVRGLAPTTPVVVVSASEDIEVIKQAARCGVSGYLPKSSPKEVMAGALQKVVGGDTYFPTQGPGDLTLMPLSPPPLLTQLTPRQLGVLQLMAEGKPNKTIAHELDISQETVKLHISAIFRKLGVTNRTQAILVAHQLYRPSTTQ